MGTALLAATDFGFAPDEEIGLARLFAARGAVRPPDDVALVRLDGDSLQSLQSLPADLGGWPRPLRDCVEDYPVLQSVQTVANLQRLPRTLYACMVDLLHRAGARMVVFDVAFPADVDREVGTGALAAAMKRHGRVVVRELTRRRLAPVALLGDRTIGPIDSIIGNHPEIARAAAAAAPFLLPQPTEVVRQFWIRHPGLADPVLLPARAIEAHAEDAADRLAQRLGQAPSGDLNAAGRHAALMATALDAIDHGTIPDDLDEPDRQAIAALERVHRGSDHAYFNFLGPPGTVPSVGLWELLNGAVDADGHFGTVPLRGAVVFVGLADLQSLVDTDSFMTAFDQPSGLRLSGVELAATAYVNLLRDNAVRVLPDGARLPLLFVLGAAMAVAAGIGTVWRGMVLALAFAAAWGAFAIAAFMAWDLWLPLALPILLILPATLLISAVTRYLAAKRSIDTYLPRGVAKRILLGRSSATTADVTVMFTDIVGFTTLSQRLQAISPAAVQAFQNRHFGLLGPAIRSQGGDIIDFTGDGVMAAWGWPDPDPDHAAQACRAALGIAAAIEGDNVLRARAGEPPVRIRIGINSGLARGGDIGGTDERRFILSGDVVNISNRVEQLGKDLCPDRPMVAILVSAATVERCGDAFDFEPLGPVALRGVAQPQPIFRLRPPPSPLRQAAVAAVAATMVVAVLAAAAPAVAQEGCPDGAAPMARLVGASGRVLVDGRVVDPESTGAPLCAGAVVEIGPRARGTIIHLSGDTILRLEENSATRLLASPEPQSGALELLRGALFFISQVRRSLTISTPVATAGIEGTEVYMRLGGGNGPALDLRVYDGVVAVAPPAGSRLAPQRVNAGERLIVEGDLQARLERPVGADAVALRLGAARELAWTLYYPPLFTDAASPAQPLGDASRLLAVGRVEDAQAALDRVGNGSADAPLRDALRAVILVTQGSAEAGLSLAQGAVDRRPSAAAPLLARSYAEQALRQLEAARRSARTAVEVEPGNAMAWARLAEVELMFGDTRRSRQAADRAVALQPTALLHVVQGFARLAAFDIDAASASFAAALDRDSEQPLAHLGMGLAQIRRNDLTAGTRSLETAAGLDPTRSLLRSYLGKAYFEDRRDATAGRQYDIARQLDPGDPTPWLYDAIRKQLANRPVEALHDLERSIELNDNRATFRSGLLLDQDLAVRNTSLGRIYEDLGFQELGVSAAAQALAHDPASAPAHRFLSDLYSGEPRLEIGRVSELLQAQLLQPLGHNPVEPGAAFTDLNIIASTGPARVSFDEFTPLFEREGLRATVSGEAGSDGTRGYEGVATGLAGRFALSAGQYHFETDGFRPNNDLTHDISDIFAQVAVTEQIGVQAEYRRRRTSEGDREIRYDPDLIIRDLDGDIDEDILRVGANVALAPDVNLLLSSVYSERTQKFNFNYSTQDVITGEDFLGYQAEHDKEDAVQQEAQLIVRRGNAALRLGGGVYDVDATDRTTSEICSAEPFCTDLFVAPEDERGGNLYAYGTLAISRSMTIEAGLAYETVNLPYADEEELSPKLGIYWRPTDRLELRAAAFRHLSRSFVVDQTIEPTSIAGFGQFLDNRVGTSVDEYSASAVYRLSRDLRLGGQLTHRNVADRLIGSSPTTGLDDDLALLFAYWTPSDRLAFSLSPRVERFRQSENDPVAGNPTRIWTTIVPLAGRYFHPSGVFAELVGTYVTQDFEEFGGVTESDRRDDGLLVDAAIGYRLPQRRGIVSLSVTNILDQRLDFRDDSFRTPDFPDPRFIPARAFLARMTLSF